MHSVSTLSLALIGGRSGQFVGMSNSQERVRVVTVEMMDCSHRSTSFGQEYYHCCRSGWLEEHITSHGEGHSIVWQGRAKKSEGQWVVIILNTQLFQNDKLFCIEVNVRYLLAFAGLFYL